MWPRDGLEALPKNWQSLGSLVLDHRRDTVWHALLAHGGYVLQYFHSKWRSDRDMILLAVTEDGESLWLASGELWADRKMVHAAVSYGLCSCALQCAAAELRVDRDILLVAVRHRGSQPEDASAALREDREVVLAAARQAGEALEFASDRWRASWLVVYATVRQRDLAPQFATQWQRDRGIVLEAVSQDARAIRFADWNLRSDEDFFIAVLARVPARESRRY